MLAERGYEFIDADAIGHEVLGREEVKRRLAEEFRTDIFNEDGEVRRPELARRVFADPRLIEKLNSIVHPPILDEIDRRIRNSQRPVVLDAALLVEKGLHEECCDLLIFVDAPRDQRLRRAQEKRSWGDDELDRREKAQLSPRAKRQHADFVIDNSGSIRQLECEVNQLNRKIRETLAHGFEAVEEDR
jgi:dephospho-CoA kinase